MQSKGTLLFILTTCLFYLCHSDQFSVASRTDRFLSLFSIVRFKNTACSAGGGLSGICYPYLTCSRTGGTDTGSCADGFGVCCLTRIGCGQSTSNNCTYIESPNYPGTFNEAMTCIQTINLASDICQVRLDVEEVNLVGPNLMGDCISDKLTFSQDNKFGQVCGITKDTHFYLQVDPAVSSTLDFTFLTDPTSYDRRWRIKVSQIACDQLSIVPCGCGQYYTTPSGTISVWNTFGTPNTYLSQHNYAICIRRELNHCDTQFTDLNEFRFVPRCGDTLEWPLQLTPVPFANHFCFQPISTITLPNENTANILGPLYFYFVTDSDLNNEHTGVGGSDAANIYMSYTQMPCV